MVAKATGPKMNCMTAARARRTLMKWQFMQLPETSFQLAAVYLMATVSCRRRHVSIGQAAASHAGHLAVPVAKESAARTL